MIGVLALQGDFLEHEQVLGVLKLPFKEVRSLADTEGLTGFIIPGGESTVMDLFMGQFGLKEWLVKKVAGDANFAVLGTCAGLILLARYGLLNVTVERNAYGRQIASFTANVQVEGVGELEGHFIRAPKITQVGTKALVLGEWEGNPVAVRQGRVWGISFHPEVAGSSALHAAVFSC